MSSILETKSVTLCHLACQDALNIIALVIYCEKCVLKHKLIEKFKYGIKISVGGAVIELFIIACAKCRFDQSLKNHSACILLKFVFILLFFFFSFPSLCFFFLFPFLFFSLWVLIRQCVAGCLYCFPKNKNKKQVSISLR